ncbi:MAG: SDR family oxidoreductase [Xanthobacteraceae bacterium]|nr:MAG: SDR family oxidoreductase [Xanthobacteraceae bacterium]
MPDRVALITGASAGIGAELARVFAANGHRVALVARRAERLHELAGSLTGAAARPPIVMACDLSQPEAGDAIAAALAAQRVEPDYVVNNAGFGLVGPAATIERAAQLAMIDVNVRALTELSLRFADSLERHHGGVLNVASVAGFLPGPNMAVYYASKAYVISFSEALHHEFGRRGVRVTALCPGPVPTEFQARAGFRPGRRSLIPALSARAVAEAGYRGLMDGRRLVVPGLANRLVPQVMRMVPRGLALALVGRFQARRAR